MEKKLNVVVIGAGVVGALIAREFAKYDCSITLIEKEEDVGWGVTKANSAIVHGGYDDMPGTTRALLCAKGNKMYDDLKEELGIDFKRIGSYVLAFNEEEVAYLDELLERAKINGVPNCEIHKRDKILSTEPYVNKDVIAGFWCPTAGITDPWMVAISACENAVDNGMILKTGEEVIKIETSMDNGIKKTCKVVTDKASYDCDIVVNAAGLWADEIAKMAGVDFVHLHPRKGEYVLLDKKIGNVVKTVLFPVPTKISKGILVLPTVDGGILLGPTAVDLDETQRLNTATTKEGLEEVIEYTLKLVPNLDISQTVKTFAGLRPESPQKDFCLGLTNLHGFINAGAMRSPGLTAAPAIAKHVVEDLVISKMSINLYKKENFNPFLKPYTHASEMPLEEWEKLIESNPAFGNVICVCNKVSEAEVVEAIKRGARTIDGVKFRTRAGFGRCQSGFCLPKIAEILSRELNIPINEIKIRSGNTQLLDQKKVR